jgi:hypothetical protein
MQAMRSLEEHGNTPGAAFLIGGLLDQSDVNSELIPFAKRWLHMNSEDRSWAHVWTRLAKRLPNDPEIQDLGKRYIAR